MSGDYNELIYQELQTQTEILQTQTEILQNMNNLYLEDRENVDMFFSIFPPLIFTYIVFGLFFRGK